MADRREFFRKFLGAGTAAILPRTRQEPGESMGEKEKARAEAATPPFLAGVPILEGLHRVIYVEPHGSLEVGFYMVYTWVSEHRMWAQQIGFPVNVRERVEASFND